MSFHPVINEPDCTGCEECAEVCPVDVFAVCGGKPVAVKSRDCMGCESCVEACPTDAIEI